MTPEQQNRLAECGWCVIPDVISRASADEVRTRLWRAAEESERRGAATRNIGLDPNEHNVACSTCSISIRSSST
jgi:hypothetical protein